MQDRPTADELLAAVEGFLRDDVMPTASGAVAFHARVAANVVATVRRELAAEEEHIASEWPALSALTGGGDIPGSTAEARDELTRREDALCNRIRRGEADDGELRQQVLDYLHTSLRNKLLVSNPRWIGE